MTSRYSRQMRIQSSILTHLGRKHGLSVYHCTIISFGNLLVEYVAYPSVLTLLTTCSIIAVHGLNPRSKKDADHAWDTWRTPVGPQGQLWLRDDLPQYIPESRIFLYEYNSTAVYGKDRSTFIDKANELLEAINSGN